MAKKSNTRVKRSPEDVDKLIAEVDRLSTDPDLRKRLSVARACTKVGLQRTVYYFRKRRDDAENVIQAAITNTPVTRSAPKSKSPVIREGLHDRKTTELLMQEYRELENRLNQIKLKIAESVMAKQHD